MSDFKLVPTKRGVEVDKLSVASATVLEAGDLVALSAGLAVKAGAASTGVALIASGSADGSTSKITAYGEGTVIEGTANRALAAADLGAPASIVLSGSDIQINLDNAGGSAGVLEVLPGSDAGTIGSASKVRARIVKGL